jgi:predicted N-formylglutamate amidohydrolase
LASADGDAALVLACEHAANAIPPEYADLGLAADHLDDHIAWDIGAGAVTEELASTLGAAAVLSGASRLLIDCNRAPSDADLILAVSDGVVIPGNAGIDADERAARLARYYLPYHAAVDAALQRYERAFLLSVHSFTPSLNGQERRFDAGVLFDAFEPLAHRLAAEVAKAGFTVRMNEPYSGVDGLIFSARSHGRRHDRYYLELEINNGLLRSASAARAVARRLAPAVAAVAALVHGRRAGAVE